MFKEGRFRNWIIGCLLFSCNAFGYTKVAVIDTGANVSQLSKVSLCKTGHYDFTTDTNSIGYDSLNHGTHIVQTIADYAKHNYCIVIYKVFDQKTISSSVIIKALAKAIDDNVDVINMSIASDRDFRAFDINEYTKIWQAYIRGIKVYAAAGNNSGDLTDNCNVYPACYNIINITTVGSYSLFSNKGNYGKPVDRFEKYCYKGICGTSISAAVATGKYIRGLK